MKFIRKIILLAAVMLVPQFVANAQPAPVQWNIASKHLSGDTFEVVFTATIPEHWHMYDMGPYDVGPNPTVFTFESTQGLKLEGKVVQQTKATRVFDEMFGVEIGYFEKKAVFSQKVVLTADKGTLKGLVEWMICDDSQCMPPSDEEFSISIDRVAKAAAATGGAATADNGKQAPVEEVAAATDETPEEVITDSIISIADNMAETPAQVAEENKAMLSQGDDMGGGGGSLWSLIIEAILWGFAALLTPCVFPMVPMTVSFFMKDDGGASRGRFKALMYGVFIVALYTLPIAAIILITRFVGGDAVTADIFNWVATHWLPNIIFFLVFMIFAASFFGAFEITMPSKLVNKSDSKADKKGLGGVFFMALTLVLVSFSCTGPIVGTVIIKSTSGEFWAPIITMLAFSTAFAIPFALFAFFPSLLSNMPKSGGWLNSVKVVLGFIEVALGLKFLSVADQTYHWGLLDRDIYLAIWIAVFSLMGLYLLGKIKFKHDSDMKYLGVGRLTLAIITFSFVIYLIPGMWGAPLKGLSGYLPPLYTQDYTLGSEGTTSTGGTTHEAFINPQTGKVPKYSDLPQMHLPHGLTGFFDLDEAQAYAESVGKPLFIDFTGHGCVNCREMEARVWSDPQVLAMLKNDYVVVALMLDDKMELPQSEWIEAEGRTLKSLGKVNAYRARTEYGVNSQPYYVLQGRGSKVLVPPRGYDLSIEGFVNFLKSGIEAYKK
jgi:thiol:disulfide interchange protein DsbD